MYHSSKVSCTSAFIKKAHTPLTCGPNPTVYLPQTLQNEKQVCLLNYLSTFSLKSLQATKQARTLHSAMLSSLWSVSPKDWLLQFLLRPPKHAARHLKRKTLCCKPLVVAFVVLQHTVKRLPSDSTRSHAAAAGEDAVCLKLLLSQ